MWTTIQLKVHAGISLYFGISYFTLNYISISEAAAIIWKTLLYSICAGVLLTNDLLRERATEANEFRY